MGPSRRFNCYFGYDSCICPGCVMLQSPYNVENYPQVAPDCRSCEDCNEQGYGLPIEAPGECGVYLGEGEVIESISLQMTVKDNIEHVINNITRVTRPEIVKLVGFESQRTILDGLCAELEYLSGLPKDMTRAEVIAGYQQETLKAKIANAGEAFQAVFKAEAQL
jgi:hypothetical protein